MKRVFSLPSMRHRGNEVDLVDEKAIAKNRVTTSNQEANDDYDVDDVSRYTQITNFHKRQPTRRLEKANREKHGAWRQEQRTSAARLEKQLKARWALEEEIEEQLNRFNAHFNRASTGPIRLKNVTQLLIPKWAPAHELAALSWLGDWRPSSILDLLCTLASSASLRDTDFTNMGLILSQLIHEIRIEETVIDEEMTEIQTNCILHIPFARVKDRPNETVLTCVQSEFKKIHRVAMKAQNLRLKTLEMVVKKVLGQLDAAEFLISFAAIQDVIHQFAAESMLQKGPVSVPTKPVDSDFEMAQSVFMKCDPLKE